jgi:DNA-binding GntR family transcriptional regulator
MSARPDSGSEVAVNYRPGIPRYLQIADAIRRELRGEGERIASEHALCARFKVSRPTIRQALDVLVQEGRLYRHAGRGTFSTALEGAGSKLRVIGSIGDMMALGYETWFKLLGRETVQVPANIAQALRLPPGSQAYRVSGIRHNAEGAPFMHVTAWLPTRIAELFVDEELAPQTSFIGLIERQLGMAVSFMEQLTEASLAPRHIAELLEVRPRAPVLYFERTYFASNGEPVEHAVTYQVTGRYPYRVVLSRSDRRG